jgi:hypothetical protein
MEDELTADERDYHKHVVAGVRDANAAMASWGQYLSRKYDLTPADRIDESGRIERDGKD